MQYLRRPAGIVAWRSQNPGDPAGRQVHSARGSVTLGIRQPLQHTRGFQAVDRPPVGARGGRRASLRWRGRRQMDIDRTGMRMTPKPVQPAESLRERPHAARLRDEVLRIDIGAHLQRLRGDRSDDGDGWSRLRAWMPCRAPDRESAPRSAPPPVPGNGRSAAGPQPIRPWPASADGRMPPAHSWACWRTPRMPPARAPLGIRWSAASANRCPTSPVSRMRTCVGFTASSRCRTTSCASSSASRSNRDSPPASPVAGSATTLGDSRHVSQTVAARGEPLDRTAEVHKWNLQSARPVC